MSTVFVCAPAEEHTKLNHPENAGRIAAIMNLLENRGVLPTMRDIVPQAATVEQLQRVHTPELMEVVERASHFAPMMLDADTYVTPESYHLARLAAGSCCTAVDAILHGQAQNGLALVRPPGHHAERGRPGGFCLFNNVAVAARHAQAFHGVKRVLIVDFDVHHGNGTQEIFYQDDSVLFVSLHLWHSYFYPGTGAMSETGAGKGQGFTLNVPLPPLVGDEGYARVLQEVVWPKAEQFRPELLLVSAGFDAHWGDPLASAGLSLTGYARIARVLLQLAEALCQGRALFVLEGGYLPGALAYGVLNVVHALIGKPQIEDPLGPLPQPETHITGLIQRLKQLHLE